MTFIVGSWSAGLQRKKPPNFEDFAVADVFKGTSAAPRLSTAQARRFRTELRRQAAGGPDFAGHFMLARWGCGGGCVVVAVVDAISGDVNFAPFSFEDAYGRSAADGQDHIVCHHSWEFRVDSELFIASGSIKGKVGTHYYRWHERRFRLVHFEPLCQLRAES